MSLPLRSCPASRYPAREFCARHARGAAAYGGYEAMFRCDRHGADACYVATRPDSHRALCERLIARRVPTLCEKPLATSVDDVAALYAAAAASRTFLMEGVWTRCFPATAKARELLRGGAIGDVVAVQAEFGYAIANGCPDGVRGSAATGGMGRDIGVYLAEKALLAFDSRDYDLADARDDRRALHAAVDRDARAHARVPVGRAHARLDRQRLAHVGGRRVVAQPRHQRSVAEQPRRARVNLRVATVELRPVLLEGAVGYPSQLERPVDVGFAHAQGEALEDRCEEGVGGET